MYNWLPGWFYKGLVILVVVAVIGGLGATVYELRQINATLDTIQRIGLDVEVRGGRVDVGNTVAVEGRVSVDGTVEVTSCDTRFRGCDPIEVEGQINVVDVWDTVDVRIVR